MSFGDDTKAPVSDGDRSESLLLRNLIRLRFVNYSPLKSQRSLGLSVALTVTAIDSLAVTATFSYGASFK